MGDGAALSGRQSRIVWLLMVVTLGIIVATGALAADRIRELTADGKASEDRAVRAEGRLEHICLSVDNTLKLYRKLDQTNDPEWKRTAQTIIVVYEPLEALCRQGTNPVLPLSPEDSRSLTNAGSEK